MAQIYVTIEEAAKLEALEYHTIYRKIQRNIHEFVIKTEPADNGGKDRILIAVSSLSKKARKAYKAMLEVNTVDLIAKKNDGEELPWYLDVDLHWYIENYKKNYYRCVELAKNIEQYLQYNDSDKTEFAKEFANKLGMSQRSLYRKAETYLQGAAWAIKMNDRDGHNYDFYKVLALCPMPKKKYTFPSITDEVKVYIENIWFDKMFAQNRGTMEMAYDALKKQADTREWDIPSYPTVNRYINYLMQTEANAHALIARGTREWKRNVMVKARRDTGALKVMELVQGDAHTFDCWVSVAYSNGKVTAIKPCLTGWMDTRSRTLVGYAVCEVPNSQVLKKSLIHMIYEKSNSPFEGVPRWILIDNGKDYTAESLTGRSRKVRVSFDSDTKGFYRSIGIEDDMRSLPYQPWSKAQIERAFGTICSRFTKWVNSYTGTLTGSKTIGKVKKDIKNMLKRGELLSIEEFANLFDKWLLEEYHMDEHSGLKEQKEKWLTPLEVYQNAERYYKAAPPMDYTQILLMKCDEVLVRTTGIKKFGMDYMHDNLFPYISQKVDIRYDPDDVTVLYVYTKEGIKICEATSQELLQIAPKASEKKLVEHIRRQKRHLRETTEKVKYRQSSYEERINLINEKKVIVPELEGRNPKVVSLPNDRQYKEEIKNKSTREKSTGNDFYAKQAEKALALIEKLG